MIAVRRTIEYQNLKMLTIEEIKQSDFDSVKSRIEEKSVIKFEITMTVKS